MKSDGGVRIIGIAHGKVGNVVVGGGIGRSDKDKHVIVHGSGCFGPVSTCATDAPITTSDARPSSRGSIRVVGEDASCDGEQGDEREAMGCFCDFYFHSGVTKNLYGEFFSSGIIGVQQEIEKKFSDANRELGKTVR